MNYDMANAMLVDSLLKGEVTQEDFYKRRKTLARENTQAEIDLLYEQFKEVELNSDEETRILEELNEKRKQLREEDLEDFLDKEAQKKEIIDSSIEAGISVANSLFEIASSFREREIEQINAQKEYELHAAGENAEAKARIEEKYNRQIAAQKRKQAQNEKLAGIFNVAIDTAIAVTKAVAASPATFGLPFSAFALASGAAQAAAIAAQPIPKFNKGTEYVNGIGTTDTVHAMLTPGERVMTREQNAALNGISNNEVVEMVNLAFALRGAGGGGGIDNEFLRSALKEAVTDGLANQTVYNTQLTEKGLQRSVKKGMQTTIILNSENR